MKRYVVTNQSSGVTQVLCDSIAEALSQAVKLQDEGSRVLVIDSQGSGIIMAGHFDVLEAEGYLGRGLGSERIDQPVPIAEVIAAAGQTARGSHLYHWDISNPDIR
jgi:hypothetical protein